MPSTRKANPWLAYALACAMVLLAACQPKTIPMTSEESQHVAKIAQHMTTRCVGRYLIDLPERFVLNSQWTAEIETVKVDVRPIEKRMFDERLADYRARLERIRLPLNGFPYLRSANAVADGLVFDRAVSDASTDRASRHLEVWGWRNGFMIQATIEAFDGSFPEDANDSLAKQLHTDVDEKLVTLLNVYKRIRGRAESELPKEQGFCVANGFVVGPPVEKEESYVAFHLADAPDVYFHLGANPEALKGDRSLLERDAQVTQEMMQSGTLTIRKGVVEHAGMPFDEWLFKGRTPDRVPGTMFTLVGNESKRGLTHPHVRLELFNGFRIPAPQRSLEESAQLKALERATLSEAEAVAVWDKVSPTLRLRPGAL